MENEKHDVWPLQDAKMRFSELVHEAQSSGPQHITVNGCQAVVVLSEQDYNRLKSERTGQELVELLGNSPLKDVLCEREHIEGPVREVDL